MEDLSQAVILCSTNETYTHTYTRTHTHMNTHYTDTHIHTLISPKNDILAFNETLIHPTTNFEKLFEYTPPGYSLFSTSSHLTKLPLAGDTIFLIIEPAIIHNSSAHS